MDQQLLKELEVKLGLFEPLPHNHEVWEISPMLDNFTKLEASERKKTMFP